MSALTKSELQLLGHLVWRACWSVKTVILLWWPPGVPLSLSMSQIPLSMHWTQHFRLLCSAHPSTYSDAEMSFYTWIDMWQCVKVAWRWWERKPWTLFIPWFNRDQFPLWTLSSVQIKSRPQQSRSLLLVVEWSNAVTVTRAQELKTFIGCGVLWKRKEKEAIEEEQNYTKKVNLKRGGGGNF